MSLRNYLAVLAGLLVATAANAAYTVNINQIGPDVVMTGNGSLDITGAASIVVASNCGVGNGSLGTTRLCVGSGSSGLLLSAAVAPFFGLIPVGAYAPTGSTGPAVFISANDVFLPAGYASGSLISNSSTYAGQTLASLTLTAGTIVTRTLPSGDTFVVNVLAVPPPAIAVAASIPTLSDYALIGLASLMGMLGVSAVRRRRRS